MRDQAVWSVGVGRYQGVHVRLHMFSLIFAAFTLYLSWIDSRTPQVAGSPSWVGLACLGMLLLGVALHELGHILAARRLGVRLEEVIISPIGGLAPLPGGLDPQAELVLAMAGPMMNLAATLFSAVALLMVSDFSLPGLMNPLAPEGITVGSSLEVLLKLAFWVNWMLLIVNLIPAYPFDGIRMLRTSLVITQIVPDGQRAAWLVTRFAYFVAIVLTMVAWAVRDSHPPHLVAPWFPLLILAIFVYFSARREEQTHQSESASDEAVLGYDFSEGYTSLERTTPKLVSTQTSPSLLVRWWERRREERLLRQREVEADEESRMDEILSRLHQTGINSLSHEDRQLLQRVSARYRSRHSTS